MASVRPGLPKSRASLALEIPSDITLDSYPGAYGQVLTNLIFNAVTHGFTDGPGGHMLIKARAADRTATAGLRRRAETVTRA